MRNMLSFLLSVHPVFLAFLAGCFTFFITLLGSALVLLFKKMNSCILNIMLALSAGIMISASFFSLLNPAIEIANEFHFHTWFIVLSGFLIGGLFLYGGDSFIDFLSCHYSFPAHMKRAILLFSSITLHNIPEGLVLGVAYGAILFSTNSMGTLLSALCLTIGIAIQNFPEGSAISLPLYKDGFSLKKSFILGSLSAIVEPFFAVLGAILVTSVQVLLPFIMSFTAGAMIFVVLMELLPELLQQKKRNLFSIMVMIGFAIMMVLEIILG